MTGQPEAGAHTCPAGVEGRPITVADAALLSNALPQIGHYRFEFAVVDDLSLHGFAGSALRGLLGRGLKKTVCVTRLPTCDGCLLRERCAYPLLFETPANLVGEERRRFANAAHPFVLGMPWELECNLRPGDRFSAKLGLFGRANGLLPFVVNAFDLAGEAGLGKRSSRFMVDKVTLPSRVPDEEIVVYERGSPVRPAPVASVVPTRPAPQRCTLIFETPLRLKRQGRLVGPGGLDARQLVTAIVRRAELLASYYGRPLAPLGPDALTPWFTGLIVESPSLRWADWTRYSSRQERQMQMGGLLGELQLGGPALGDLWPLLERGQLFHIGKGTSMGLGRYRLVPASLSDLTGGGAA